MFRNMFRFRPAAMLLVLALVASSCQRPLRATVGSPIAVPIGRIAAFDRDGLGLRFTRVVSDSRCPKGVQCIVAGDALIAVDARAAGTPSQTIQLGLMGSSEAEGGKPYGHYRLRLVGLEPYPVAGQARDTLAYVATLLVEKR